MRIHIVTALLLGGLTPCAAMGSNDGNVTESEGFVEGSPGSGDPFVPDGTGGSLMPTASAPAHAPCAGHTGEIRYNALLNQDEACNGTTWEQPLSAMPLLRDGPRNQPPSPR